MPGFAQRSIGCAQLLLLLLATSFASSNSAHAGSDRDCDTVWLISTRGLPCGHPQLHADELSFQVRDQHGHWQRADLAGFLSSGDPTATTVFWIHGNRYSHSEAVNNGIATYRALVNCTSCTTPIRFVIFSWPSDQIEGSQLDDVRIKAARADPNAYYLARLIDQMNPQDPVSVIGYSFGGRIASGALHLLGGGVLNGWVLGQPTKKDRRGIDLVLIAAGMDNHWLIPGHRYGNAMSQVNRLTVIYNSCDRVLKRYRYLYCHASDAEALGFTGIAGLRIGIDRTRVTQIDACCYVGKFHPWENYLASGAIFARIRAAAILATARVAAK